jgi:hypothetical protein
VLRYAGRDHGSHHPLASRAEPVPLDPAPQALDAWLPLHGSGLHPLLEALWTPNRAFEITLHAIVAPVPRTVRVALVADLHGSGGPARASGGCSSCSKPSSRTRSC